MRGPAHAGGILTRATVAIAVAALLLASCRSDNPQPAAARDSTINAAPAPAPAIDAAITGARTLQETSIPAEAYRVAAGSDQRWAWAARRGPAFFADGTGAKVGVAGSNGVMALGFSADGQYLLAGLARFEVQTRAIVVPVGPAQFGVGFTGKLLMGTARKAYQVMSAAWAPDGELVVASVHHRPGREEGPLPEGLPSQRLLAFDAAGALVADLGRDAHPHLVVGTDWVFATGGLTIDAWKRTDLTTPEKPIPAHPGIAALALSRDQTWLAFASNAGIRSIDGAGSVTLWNIAAAAKGAEWQADRHVADVAWHPDGVRLATAGDGGAKLWRIDGTTAVEIADAGVAGVATAVAFTPDGRELLVALGGQAARVVRLAVE